MNEQFKPLALVKCVLVGGKCVQKLYKYNELKWYNFIMEAVFR